MKKFKEFLEGYGGGNFVGLGGFSIGSLDSYKPIASLGPSDRPPNMYPQGDKRGTTATYPQKNIKKKKRRTTDIEPELENTALYNHLKEKGLIKQEDKELDKFLDDLKNNSPNSEMFDDIDDLEEVTKDDIKKLKDKISKARDNFYKNLKKGR